MPPSGPPPSPFTNPAAPFAASPPPSAPPPPVPAPWTPPQAPVPQEAPKDTRTDHAKLVGRFGIGFIGIGDLPIATARPIGTASHPGLSPNDHVDVATVSAPAIGARIWLRQRIGIDTGIGFSYSGGSTSSDFGGNGQAIPKQSVLGLLLHLGVPLVAADIEHMALLVVPEASFGMARSNVKPAYEANAPPSAELRGYRLDLGVRIGGEIHFGFMGLPNLALEAGVALAFTNEWVSATAGSQSVSDSSARLTTLSLANPWDIFKGVGNVAARYYF